RATRSRSSPPAPRPPTTTSTCTAPAGRWSWPAGSAATTRSSSSSTPTSSIPPPPPRPAEGVVPETDSPLGRRRGPDAMAARRPWRRVQNIQLHTELERRNMIEAFGVRPERTTVTAHGAHFIRRTAMTREAARRPLGSPAGELVFLAIGFIQPHKAFDQAVRAFDGLGGQGCSLHIVGSVRGDEPQHLAHLAALQALVEATPGAHLHNQYVSDEQFDRWLVASDVVVLPYRNIWSSGVLERALLYDRRVIATAVGGLSHQAAARPGVP